MYQTVRARHNSSPKRSRLTFIELHRKNPPNLKGLFGYKELPKDLPKGIFGKACLSSEEVWQKVRSCVSF